MRVRHSGITAFKKLQSIIISGESGAGKTEATKRCLQYIAEGAKSDLGVEKKILMANPILEAFGNAKTLRNDNSSRFGKYMEIFFNSRDKICGAATQNYLLEKVRVSDPSDGERNFHVFYQLIKGADTELRRSLKIEAEPGVYQYLKSCTDVETIDDKKDFGEVSRAFKDLEFDQSEVIGLYSIVAAVLALGQLSFNEAKPDQAGIANSSSGALADAAAIIKIDSKTLATALTTREIRITGQETMKAALDPKQAVSARHALCKFVYERMFDWLVERVNKAMKTVRSGGTGQVCIGILDIFGFEIFKHNSFEQLCINFTNEMLQQHFNNNTFKLEEAIYRTYGCW